MKDPRRMPSLVIPFTLLGLGVGWLEADLLGSPALHGFPSAGLAGGLLGGVTGALVGAIVQRRCGPEAARLAPWTTRIRFAFLVLVGGLGAGLFARPSQAGALAGVAGAAVFLPLGAMVLGAARRAARARLGSIVAGSDRRAIGVLLAGTLAVASIASIVSAPGWSVAAEGRAAPPLHALACAIGAAVILLFLVVADARALGRLARARDDAGTMAPCDPRDALDDARVPRVDLGLGGAVWARVTPGSAAYRSRDRVVALLVGSQRRARAALSRAIGRGVFALAVAGAAIAVHMVARGPRGPVALRMLLCDMGDRWQCGELLLERACEEGDGARCRSLAELLESSDAPARDPGRALVYLARGCALGDDASCAARPAPDLERAVVACMRGARGECAAAGARFEEAGELARAAYFEGRAR